MTDTVESLREQLERAKFLLMSVPVWTGDGTLCSMCHPTKTMVQLFSEWEDEKDRFLELGPRKSMFPDLRVAAELVDTGEDER